MKICLPVTGGWYCVILKNKQMKKTYFHELSQRSIRRLQRNGVLWLDIMERYSQPDWCSYENALGGILGCQSLIDCSTDGGRNKISPNYCASCSKYKKQ